MGFTIKIKANILKKLCTGISLVFLVFKQRFFMVLTLTGDFILKVDAPDCFFKKRNFTFNPTCCIMY